MRRRNAIQALLGTTLSAFVGKTAYAQGASASPPMGTTVLNVQELGADPTGNVDATSIFQAAINQLAGKSGSIYIPAGTYRISRTLECENPVNARASGLLFYGDGEEASVLKSFVQTGPLLRVRGVPRKGPVSTTFFWGGGIRGLRFDGSFGGEEHDALEVLGWWHAEVSNFRIVGFSRHGIRARTDLDLNSNPDFSASVLFLRAVKIERCGGWGFIDDGGPQGAPSWSWDRCIFNLCRLGGAFVQSSSQSYTKCSFSGCGWHSERKPPTEQAWGLFFSGAMSATSRQWVEGCEFDTNLTAHIGARFLSNSTFVNNRFIFNDRFKAGRLCPGVGVQIGVGDAHAAVRSVEFRQSVFRFDRGGEAVGFDWVNTANVRDIDIRGSVFSDNSGGKLALVRYRGNDPGGRGGDFGYSVSDRDSGPRGPAGEK